MKYIGEGFYYQVYEYNAERVLKKPLSFFASAKKIYDFKREREDISRLDALTSAFKAVKREKKELQTIKERISSLPGDLFANPQFMGRGLNYTQDKARIIEDTLQDDKVSETIVDKYIELQKKLWSYGLHDTTFKIQPNYGVDKNGNVVCIDFGEFVFTKEQALASIAKKKWLTRGTYKKWADGPIKKYYTARMAEAMTSEAINKFWATKLWKQFSSE